MPARPSVLEQHLDIVGIEPDAIVAKKAGISASAVRQWRVRHGIPARWRGEEAEAPAAADPAAGSGALTELPAHVPVDVRMSISDVFVWVVTLKDEDAALGEVELPGENEVLVVARDVVGAARAAQTLGTARKIEMKMKVLLAPDICPV